MQTNRKTRTVREYGLVMCHACSGQGDLIPGPRCGFCRGAGEYHAYYDVEVDEA